MGASRLKMPDTTSTQNVLHLPQYSWDSSYKRLLEYYDECLLAWQLAIYKCTYIDVEKGQLTINLPRWFGFIWMLRSNEVRKRRDELPPEHPVLHKPLPGSRVIPPSGIHIGSQNSRSQAVSSFCRSICPDHLILRLWTVSVTLKSSLPTSETRSSDKKDCC